jgi:PhnB protein
MKMNAYLNFGGKCEEAFQFYEKHLGGTDLCIMRWSQMPDSEKHTPPGFANFVLHAKMQLGETTLMASDVPGFQPIRSVYLALGVKSNEEAERIYNLLSEGGEIYIPMGETFFAHRFGQLRDKFGVSWMIIHDRPMPGA